MVVSETVERVKLVLDRKCRSKYFSDPCPLREQSPFKYDVCAIPCWLCKEHLAEAEEIASELEPVKV